jgi:hypothetical protein
MTTTSTLTARDLAVTTAEANRNEWTRGQLDAVVAALAGAQVLIVCDKYTGFTVLGTLECTTSGSFTNAHGALRVVTEYSSTEYRVLDIGAIVVMPGQAASNGARWRAADNYRALQTAGVNAARAHAEAQGYTADLRYTATPMGAGRVLWTVEEYVTRENGARMPRQIAYGTLTGVSLEPTPAP